MTTPGRLALVAITVVAGTLCFGVIATLAERSRAAATDAARTRTEPLLVQAVTLYSSLSDANATATTTFLTGGLEPAARRAHYLLDLRLASQSLTTLTRETGDSRAARAAVQTITDQLPLYSGLVESARANNLQGFPVGAAYLRQASARLTGTILPAAEQLYRTEATRLGDDYRRGTSTVVFVALGVGVVLALGVLVAAQRFLTRVSRRILNVWMALATVVVLAVSIWVTLALISERNALLSAQRNGSDSVEVLSATRVLLSRAQSDQSLTLVNRGSDETDPRDFAAVMRVLSLPQGMLGEAASLAGRTGTSEGADTLARELRAYQAQTAQIALLQKRGKIEAAATLAVSDASQPSSPAERLSADLTAQIGAAQARFARKAADATSALSGLALAIPLLAVVAAILAAIGIRQRQSEYR